MMGRPDFDAIASWIRPASRVLDLGCGNGDLLKYLTEKRTAKGYGVEINDDNLLASVRRGINVIQMDLESGLSIFESNSFDYVVLSQTLQAVQQTELIVKEMLRVIPLVRQIFRYRHAAAHDVEAMPPIAKIRKRVGKEGIVTFPRSEEHTSELQSL